MDIMAGGIVTAPQLLLGTIGGGDGTVNVNGGTVTTSGIVVVGTADSASGTMHISSGGTVSGGQFAVGAPVDSTGNATIDGASSSVTVQGTPGPQPLNIAVGQRGNGTLAMTNGASATAPVVSIGQYPGAVGQATISSGATLHATSYLGVGTAFNPFSDPPVDVGADGGNGTLIVNAGSTAKAGVRLLTGNGGTVDLAGGGRITVGDVGASVPAASSVLIGSGGTVNGTGTIIGAMFNEGGVVQPGFSTGIMDLTGPYTQTSGGTLQIEIGGTSRGTLYDALLATGPATLSGTLQVSLINGFAPALNDEFDVLDASSITGPFSNIDFSLAPLSGSLAWDTSQLNTAGVLRVVAGPDFNGNSFIDGADYVMWRNNPSRTEAQYTTWRANFGNPWPGSGGESGQGESAMSAVPEPSSLLLMMAGFATIRCLYRRR
jgi:T5SS/PEP-CTERM-associated repeat protein